MKILQVISFLYPAWAYGGPGKLVYELSKQLKKNGDLVTIFTTDAYDQERRRIESDNQAFKKDKLDVYFFKNISNKLSYTFRIFFPPASIIRIIKESKNFDVIHIHEFFTPLAVFVSFFAKMYKIPVFISAHGTLDEFHLNHRKNIKKIFMFLFGKFMLGSVSVMIAATKDEIEEYEALGVPKRKIVYVANGIDISLFQKRKGNGLFRRKYQISSDEKIILYLGRINKLKGLDVLLKSFTQFKDRHNIRLIIAGSDDGYLSVLKEKVKKQNLEKAVVFPGVIFGDKKLSLYLDSNIFVYPSPSEGFSLAILEAGASGLPLVVTKGCKFPQIIKYQAGFLVNPKVTEMKDALEKLIKDDSLRKQTGRNAAKLVREKFSIKFMAQILHKLYLQEVGCYERN